MAEEPAVTGNGTPARTRGTTSDAQKQGLAHTLETKREQGYTVESESETQAVVAIKGRRRWFGLMNSPSVRYEVNVDDAGDATNRRL